MIEIAASAIIRISSAAAVAFTAMSAYEAQ